jgi:hypothetical protein
VCSYAPYALWACANGHEQAKAQLAKAGIGFAALDNGLRSVEDPARARRTCARLGSGHLRGLLGRMTTVMPGPLTTHDRRAGFDWAFSIAQLEISGTAVPDQPRRARAWSEAAIGAHLDLGRPERVSLVVNRTIINRGPHKTPGRFATEVITADVAPHPRRPTRPWAALRRPPHHGAPRLGGIFRPRDRWPDQQGVACSDGHPVAPGYSSAQATYDLRRLRLKGFIERVTGTNTYRVTKHGLRMATFFTHLASRVVVPALTDLARLGRPGPSAPRPLTGAWRNYERELAFLIKRSPFAA